ncbi:hypothetical protein INR79_25855 [Vibrio sp. SCSIO 43132]|uniref:hypothetical protein n=1 Tax=Vibrio sp. SCSIO 43132 TaxID=2779363 RepID=UPI001CA8539E|nr:hypothetical protein [Vibrio sp. SCSIO 43132]UAB72682.1 hypothetical protein INR79_25855 [Vibrio sp. SCSIO 43132]
MLYEISELIDDEILSLNRNVVIGITGPTGVGKSWLTRKLSKLLGGVVCISSDAYLPNNPLLRKKYIDLDPYVDYGELERDIIKFLKGDFIHTKLYCHKSRKVKIQDSSNKRIMIVEGSLISCFVNPELFDLTVFLQPQLGSENELFIDTSTKRDYSQEKKESMSVDCIKNYKNHMETLKKNADIIIEIGRNRAWLNVKNFKDK